jgi:hypothetical protein
LHRYTAEFFLRHRQRPEQDGVRDAQVPPGFPARGQHRAAGAAAVPRAQPAPEVHGADVEVGLHSTPGGCHSIGYVDRTGCHLSSTEPCFRPYALLGLHSLPGVGLVTWNILGVINWQPGCVLTANNNVNEKCPTLPSGTTSNSCNRRRRKETRTRTRWSRHTIRGPPFGSWWGGAR